MNDTQKKKRNFRASKKWKEFRHKKHVEQNGRCYITRSKLNKCANLHHLDGNDEHYEDVSNPDNFVFVLKSVHDVIHTMYRYYKKDREVLDRLKEVLDRMCALDGA